MCYFRRQQNLRTFLCIIAVAVFLRSFIAPGYMLKASAEDGLGIIFCDGPVSLYIPQDDHSAHHHHGDDSDTQQETHISPICSQWSTSSLLVFNTIVVPVRLDAERTVYSYHYTTPYFQQYSDFTRVIRGPPSLS